MRTTALRVARRFLAASIPIQVDRGKTQEVRNTGHRRALVATFLGSVRLYRILDGEELDRIFKSGKVTGGTYSVKAERAFGAAWGSEPKALIKWGNSLRGGRLGTQLYLAEMDARGKTFIHLDPGVGLDATTVDPSKFNPGLGANVSDVSIQDIKLSVVSEQGNVQPLTLAEAKARADQRSKKPVELRKVNSQLYQGSILGVDIRIWQDKGVWGAYTNDGRQIASRGKTPEDAIELAQIAIRMRPEKPVPTDMIILEQRRKYDKQFDVDDDEGKVRGGFGVKPRDVLIVEKGSRTLDIQARSKLTVADVYQLKGERAVVVKVLVGSRPKVLYVPHKNQLGKPEFSLLDSRGAKVVVRKR